MPNTYRDDDSKSFLQEARDRFKYCIEAWRDIREQHDLDMRFLAGDSWDPTEARKRKDKNMPMIHLDELTQYINQLINDVRQNKHAVNVLPKGSGANDKTAALRADWIRAVEYISQAQTAYTTAFEGAAGGSYGFWKLETYYENPKSFNLSARIVPVTNANTIIFDPDCKHYDCSDAEDCWEIDFISKDTFKRRYPDAEIKTFSDEVQKVDPYWIKSEQVQIASWWKVKVEKIQLHLVDLEDEREPIVMRSDQLPKGMDEKRILKSRDYDDRRIVQYVLNGVEVLETNDPRKGKGWPGQWIPIIPVWGKELFVDDGSGSKRMLFSLIRLARDPQRLLNYYAAQEMAEAKMSPRTPYMAPRGMMSANHGEWEEVNDTPKAFIEYDVPEGIPPGSVEPKRVPFVPNFQAYEMAKESTSRSIMKAMGISPLPTDAQRANNKSGIALKKIQGERAQGSFHFIDNFDRSLVYCGKQLDDLFDRIHDTARDIPVRKEDGTHSMARIGDQSDPKNKEFAGDHDVTITTGPSFESQREEAADFADTLAQVEGVFPLIGDLLVKLRNLGPIGDSIAERLTPPQFASQNGEDVPATAKAAIARLTQQAQQMQQVIAQLTQEKAAKMIEKDAQYRIAALQENTKLVVAQATLQRDKAESILQTELQKIQTILGQAHDQATQATDQQHEKNLAEQQHQHDLALASHTAALAPTEPANTNGAGGAQ
jgi:hypothetical protein